MKTMSNEEIIETGLGSIGKIKILKALSEENKLATIYLLHKKTHLKRDDIKNSLKNLMEIGWVKEIKLANNMYSINRENEYVKHLVSFFNQVGYTGQP